MKDAKISAMHENIIKWCKEIFGQSKPLRRVLLDWDKFIGFIENDYVEEGNFLHCCQCDQTFHDNFIEFAPIDPEMIEVDMSELSPGMDQMAVCPFCKSADLVPMDCR